MLVVGSCSNPTKQGTMAGLPFCQPRCFAGVTSRFVRRILPLEGHRRLFAEAIAQNCGEKDEKRWQKAEVGRQDC